MSQISWKILKNIFRKTATYKRQLKRTSTIVETKSSYNIQYLVPLHFHYFFSTLKFKNLQGPYTFYSHSGNKTHALVGKWSTSKAQPAVWTPVKLWQGTSHKTGIEQVVRKGMGPVGGAAMSQRVRDSEVFQNFSPLKGGKVKCRQKGGKCV